MLRVAASSGEKSLLASPQPQGAAVSELPTNSMPKAHFAGGGVRRLESPLSLFGSSETAAYRCSRDIRQSAGKEPRPGSPSSPRQIVNNSAAPAAALRWSCSKLSDGHAAPGHELPPLSSNDSKETFGPSASSRSIDEYSDDNCNKFSVSISHGSSGVPGDSLPNQRQNSTQKEQFSDE